MDDARYVATLVRTAAAYGAQVANRARVVGFLREGERVVGARVQDVEAGGEYEVRARQVVNATGVWTDDTQALIGERGQFHVRASKGIHLVVPKDRIHSTTGLILRTEKTVLFVIPWGRHWIVGTTDTDWDLDKAHPAASSADIDYLLEHVNSVLAVPLTRDDVEGVYAGPAAAAGRRVGRDQQAVPRAHRRASGAGPGGRGGRQVHDVPGDGQGRGGRGGARTRMTRRIVPLLCAAALGAVRDRYRAGQTSQSRNPAAGSDELRAAEDRVGRSQHQPHLSARVCPEHACAVHPARRIRQPLLADPGRACPVA